MNARIAQSLPALGSTVEGGLFHGILLLDGHIWGEVTAPKALEIVRRLAPEVHDVPAHAATSTAWPTRSRWPRPAARSRKQMRAIAHDGFDDWYLPARGGQLLQWANLKPLLPESRGLRARLVLEQHAVLSLPRLLPGLRRRLHHSTTQQVLGWRPREARPQISHWVIRSFSDSFPARSAGRFPKNPEDFMTIEEAAARRDRAPHHQAAAASAPSSRTCRPRSGPCSAAKPGSGQADYALSCRTAPSSKSRKGRGAATARSSPAPRACGTAWPTRARWSRAARAPAAKFCGAQRATRDLPPLYLPSLREIKACSPTAATRSTRTPGTGPARSSLALRLQPVLRRRLHQLLQQVLGWRPREARPQIFT
jgi:hypothetical protein